jgi:hypothetical protein
LIFPFRCDESHRDAFDVAGPVCNSSNVHSRSCFSARALGRTTSLVSF